MEFGRALAKRLGGRVLSPIFSSLRGVPLTAHLLGGSIIGRDETQGVIDAEHRVFGYRGLYVCDASAIPVNLGINPSLTIAAMAERAMSRIPVKLGRVL